MVNIMFILGKHIFTWKWRILLLIKEERMGIEGPLDSATTALILFCNHTFTYLLIINLFINKVII